MHAFAEKSSTPWPNTAALSKHGGRGDLRRAEPNAYSQHAARRKSAGADAARFGHDLSLVPAGASSADRAQTKLAVNKSGDAYEREADGVAAKVMGAPEAGGRQGACACGGSCPKCSQRHGAGEEVQTKRAGEGIQTKRAVAHDADAAGVAPRSVEETLESAGRPLDAHARDFFESRFGHDFGHVRVHTDARAAESATDVNARAYTSGGHIVFARGEYAPSTREGGRLLAHELAHVLQQGAGGARLIQREEPKGDTTDYRFDTYRMTEADLSNPETLRKLTSLTRPQQVHYHDNAKDHAVVAHIEKMLDDWLDTRFGSMTLDRIFVERAAEKDAEVRGYIDRWLARRAPTSYEIAVGAKPGETATALSASGISVKVMPDEYVDDAAFKALAAQVSSGEVNENTKSITTTKPLWQPHWVAAPKTGVVTAVKPSTQQFTIKTVYVSGTPRTTQSGYGVGTRAEDVASKRTTLAHHEGAHAACFVKYVKDTAPPAFTGKVGDTAKQIGDKARAFDAAMKGYYKGMTDLCGPAVDCTGTKAKFCP